MPSANDFFGQRLSRSQKTATALGMRMGSTRQLGVPETSVKESKLNLIKIPLSLRMLNNSPHLLRSFQFLEC